MAKEKNVMQVDRFDGKNSFVEVCSCFEIEKVRVGFRQYDNTKGKGDKLTGQVDIFLSLREAGILANKIMMKEINVTEPDKYGQLYDSPLGGAEIDGKTISRKMKILTADKAPFRIMGVSGPGERTGNGLIQPVGKPDTQIAILFTADNLIGFGVALENAIARQNIYSGVAAINSLKAKSK